MHRFLGQIVCAVLGADEPAHFIERGLAHARRVGAHVSNQADPAFLADLDAAFVQTLRQHHRLLDRKTELARRFLLQLRSNKGWDWIALALFRRDFTHNERLFFGLGNQVLRLRLFPDQDFSRLDVIVEGAGLDRLLANF